MKITVIGLGHLGTVASGELAAEGHDVTGLDVDERRVQALQEGRLPFYEPGLQKCLSGAVAIGNLRFLQSEDFDGCMGDIALIAVGTPTTTSGEADLSQVRAALAWVRNQEPRDLVLLMKSTVPPGSGLEFLRSDLKGLAVDYIANPEFLREGRALQDWKFPDRIVLGADSCSGKAVNIVRKMYSGIEAPFLVTDITSAEMIKYATNAFLATRISFMNEMASLCDAVGASVDAVSEGLALDGRTGNRIHAGVGYGGSCLPKDIRALKHMAHSAGSEAGLLRAVVTVNNRQRQLPLSKLDARFGGRLEGLKVGVLGLAFKPGTDDVREAASLELIRSLVERGARVRAFDPQASPPARELLPPGVEFVDEVEETAACAQALILLTEWEEIVQADWAAMARQMSPPMFLFDGRNALDPSLMTQLGFDYSGVGRGDAPRSAVSESDQLEGPILTANRIETKRSSRCLKTRQSERSYA